MLSRCTAAQADSDDVVLICCVHWSGGNVHGDCSEVRIVFHVADPKRGICRFMREGGRILVMRNGNHPDQKLQFQNREKYRPLLVRVDKELTAAHAPAAVRLESKSITASLENLRHVFI